MAGEDLDPTNWAGRRVGWFKRSRTEVVSSVVLGVLTYVGTAMFGPEMAQFVQVGAAIIAAVFVLPLLEVSVQAFRAPTIKLEREAASARQRIGALTADVESLKASIARLHAMHEQTQWARATEIFRGLIEQDPKIHVVFFEYNDGAEAWNVVVPEPAHSRAFLTACELASEALMSSDIAGLPPRVTGCIDKVDRWLEFVAYKEGFRDASGSGYDGTVDPPRSWTTKGIRSPALASKRLCEDCANRQLLTPKSRTSIDLVP